MSKPSAPRMFLPASWIVAVAVLARPRSRTRRRFAHATRKQDRQARLPQRPRQAPALKAQDSGRVRASLAALPLAFEANQGQTDPQVKYMARGKGYTVFLTANDTVFAVQSSSLAVDTRVAQNHGVAGTTRARRRAGNCQSSHRCDSPAPRRRESAIANYRRQPTSRPQQLLPRSGSPPVASNVPQYARICYRDAYPGVDMAFYGVAEPTGVRFHRRSRRQSRSQSAFDVSGAIRIVTDPSGNLILASSAGDVLLHKPVAYQRERRSAPARRCAFCAATPTIR